MAFVFVLAAGFTLGLAFDLFVLSLLCVPLYLLAFIAMSHAGIISAFLTASEFAAILQFGYVAGLLLRGNFAPFAPVLAAEERNRRER